MKGIDLLLVAGVAIICGTISQLTSRYSKGGWIVNLLVGYLGALVGVVASRSLNAPPIYDLKVQEINFPIIYSIVGCVFFLAAISLIVKPGR